MVGRFRVGAIVAALSCVFAGCAPGGATDPPSTTVDGSGVSTTASSTPSPTPTPTPTPQWTAEEQAVIDAVDAYLVKWAYIGQNLSTTDWNTIYEVAKEPQATGDLQVWRRWKDKEWRLVGTPVFFPVSVGQTMTDNVGDYYAARGCYVIEDSYISDTAGNSVGDDGRQERGVVTYEVLFTWDGDSRVTDSHREDGTC